MNPSLFIDGTGVEDHPGFPRMLSNRLKDGVILVALHCIHLSGGFNLVT
jgi:hypothetical protein